MDVHYRVKVLPERHQLEVQLTLGGLPPGPVRLHLPTWVPGAYGFMKYARDLFDVRASDARTGAPLTVLREGWSGFRVEGSHAGAVHLRYGSGGFDPAWGELVGLVDHTYAILLGTRYLQVEGYTGPVRVRYEAPVDWPLHHPGGALRLPDGEWEYPSPAALLDAPVVMGTFTRITRTLLGATFHCVFVDTAVGFEREVEGFVDEVLAIAQQAHALFGSFPFEDYTFVFSFDPTAHWGLEHAHATMVGLGPEALIDPTERARGLRVAAHELYHAWNVCRLKPQALMSPDFTGGSFPAELWVSEGFTRYYEFLLLVRAGLLAPEDLLGNLVNYHRALTQLPAYARVSPADSSRATFLNHNRYPGAANATIDYYDAGMLVAFDLDATLRTLPTPRTLDADFREFYARFVAEGFTQEQLRDFFAERAPEAGALLGREMDTPAGLTTLAQLERLGFEVRLEASPRLGLFLKGDSGPVISDLLDTLPAGRSGLAPGDELLRVAGHPFSLKALRWSIAHTPAVALEVRRGHRTLAFTVEAAAHRSVTSLVWRGDADQLARVRAWLGRPDFSPAPGAALPLTSHDNFHGIQTLV